MRSDIAMRIVTWNVNGIRAAIRKGLDEFVTRIDPSILLLQETRALEEQLPKGWYPGLEHTHLHPAEKKGYSGVATWSMDDFEVVGTGIDTRLDPADSEGRMLHTQHGDLHCLNCYLPSGSNKAERQIWKEGWMEDLLEWARPFTEMDAPVVLCGDLNIAHTEDDIWNPTGNRRTSGFLPQERSWFDRLLASGWHDLLRIDVGPGKGPYSWWSNRGQARILDRGWRIDYVLGNAAALPLLQRASVLREGGLVVSDHAPVIVDLDL
jgi:exodeoxyribonuclease-3